MTFYVYSDKLLEHSVESVLTQQFILSWQNRVTRTDRGTMLDLCEQISEAHMG